MKTLFFSILSMAFIAGSAWKQPDRSVEKLEIVEIDSTGDHFVFKTKNEAGKQVTVLAEQEKLIDCRPFKKFIIADSVHQTSTLKAGSSKDIVGFYLSTINGIKIRDEGELVKIIWNCACFTDK